MVTYIFQRLFSILVSLFGVSLLVFFMVHLIPGDAALTILGERASEESLAKLRQEMGLNLPLYQQYGKYLWDLIHFNLGRSFRTNQQVVDDLVRYFPATVVLSIFQYGSFSHHASAKWVLVLNNTSRHPPPPHPSPSLRPSMGQSHPSLGWPLPGPVSVVKPQPILTSK